MTSKNDGGKTLSNMHIVKVVSLNKSVMLEESTDFTHKRAKTRCRDVGPLLVRP
jgi:hypothetical protein